MAHDDTKINYISQWDIDQIVSNVPINNISIPLASSFTSFLLVSHGLSFIPIIDGQWQFVGETVWRQFGDTISVSGANFLTFLNVDTSGVYIQFINFGSTRNINVRIQTWTDTVIY